MSEDEQTIAPLEPVAPVLPEQINLLPPQPLEEPKLNFKLIRWIGLGLGFLVLAFVAWSLVHVGFLIPQSSLAVIVTSPHAASALPASVRSTFPPAWQEALSGDSRWPVVLGLFQQDQVWHRFAIGPRWRMNGVGDAWQETHGLFSLVSDVKPAATQIFYYSSALGWRLRHPLSAQIAFVDVRSVWPPSSDPATVPSPFWIFGSAPRFATSLPFQTPIQPLEKHDVSVIVSAVAEARTLVQPFLDRISIGDQSVADLFSDVAQIGLGLDASGGVQSWSLHTSTPLSLQDRQHILASLRVVNHRSIQLSDGTVVSEQRLATIGDQNTFLIPSGTGTTPLVFDQNSAHFGPATSDERVLPCQSSDQPVAYFSRDVVTRILHFFALEVGSSADFELAVDHGTLVACFQ